MSPLGAEVGKILMLHGLKRLYIADDCLVNENDANFLIDVKTDIGKNRAEASRFRLKDISKLVKIKVNKRSPKKLTSNYIKKFDLVILIDQSFDTVKNIDGLYRKQKIRFIAGGVYGSTGYAFFDFDGFEFLIPAPKEHALVDEKEEDDKKVDLPSPTKKIKLDCQKHEKNLETVTLEEDNAKIKQFISYPSFADSLDFDPEKLTQELVHRLKPANFIIVNALLRLKPNIRPKITAEDFKSYVDQHANNPLSNLATEALKNNFEVVTDPPLPAACEIVGGVLGQEAIKSLSQNDAPLKNFYAYNAVDAMGYIYDLPLIK